MILREGKGFYFIFFEEREWEKFRKQYKESSKIKYLQGKRGIYVECTCVSEIPY